MFCDLIVKVLKLIKSDIDICRKSVIIKNKENHHDVDGFLRIVKVLKLSLFTKTTKAALLLVEVGGFIFLLEVFAITLGALFLTSRINKITLFIAIIHKHLVYDLRIKPI